MTAEQFFDDANRLFRDDLYWAALLRYRQASEAGLNTPLLHYNTGVAHYRAQQHIRAREELLKALDSPFLRVTTQYNLGLNAYAAGDTNEALRWFRLARDQQENETISDYARVAIARIRAQQALDDPIIIEKEKRRREQSFADLDLRGRVSFGNDSNVFRSPSDQYVDFSDPALPLITPQELSGVFMPVSLSAKYTVNAFKYEGFFGAYRMSGRYYQDKELDNANEYSHELSFGNEYRRKDEDSGRDRRVYSAFKVAQHDEVYYDPDDGDSRIVENVVIDDRMNYIRYGPELSFRQTIKDLTFGFNFTGQLWNYEELDVVPEYDHEYLSFGLYTQYRFSPTSFLRVSGNMSTRQYGDRRGRDLDGTLDIANEDLRYDYVDFGVLARQRITDDLWFGVEYEYRDREDQYLGYNNYTRDSYGGEVHWSIGERVELEFSGYYRLYDYPNAFAFNNSLAPLKTLETANGNFIATFQMTRHLALVFEAEYREQASNDTRIQYDRNQFILGVLWEQ